MCVIRTPAISVGRFLGGSTIVTDIPVLLPEAVNVSGQTAWFCFTAALRGILLRGGGAVPLVAGSTQLISDLFHCVFGPSDPPKPPSPAPSTAPQPPR